MKKGGKGIICWSEIAILIIATFAFAYIIHETDKGLVSAAENEPAYTCINSKDDKICQEYAASECNLKCDGECIPTQRSDVADCKLGTCYDKAEGICQTNSPKVNCEPFGGQWLDDPFGNVPECKKGCCLLGRDAFFVTEQQCNRQASLLGKEKKFDATIRNELSCLTLASNQADGACITPPLKESEKNQCKFSTQEECYQRNGDFYAGYLCSNAALNTACEKQKTTGCADGKDEVYWFDSCGNMENIYSADKLKSWNDGKVLSKTDSCSIFSQANTIANQKTCGNCIYVLGSRCGLEDANNSLADTRQDVVCRDLSCIDENGKKRVHGESWCAYQSSIGTAEDNKGNEIRSTDVAGSRHFKKVCADGEVKTEPCADYRNEICVEEQANINAGEKFSGAACRINRWQECLSYNKDTKTKDAKDRRDQKCTDNPDCFIKKVNIDKEFKFNVCVPRYPPGFDLESNPDGARTVCSFADQKCTVIYVKEITGWECALNCDCETSKFTQQMNDFCMSLGDCGAKANIAGEVTKNYKIKKAPKLGKSYLAQLVEYAKPVLGKIASPGNVSQFSGFVGIPSGTGSPNIASSGNLGSYSTLAGMAGAGAAFYANYLAKGSNIASISPGTYQFFKPITTTVSTAIPFTETKVLATPSISQFKIDQGGAVFAKVDSVTIGGIKSGPGTSGYESGLAYSGFETTTPDAQGFVKLSDAQISQLKDSGGLGNSGGFTKLDANGNPASSSGMVSAIQIAGYAMIALSAVMTLFDFFKNPLKTKGSAFTLGIKLVGTLAGLIPGFGTFISIGINLLLMILGVGKTKKVIVSFTCQAWQAPVGGAKCAECGDNRFPCSKYACSSFGQNCEFINEGTDNELCVATAGDDTRAPAISAWEGALNTGLSYSYSEVSDSGYKLTSSENEGCIKAYEDVSFGILTDEVAQCRLDTRPGVDFEEMEYEFSAGESGLYLYNHSMEFSIPSLESLGIDGYDPSRKADMNLYVKCQDRSGNANSQEYTIRACVRPGYDVTPPVIKSREPDSDYIAYDAISQDMDIIVNEPAECKWDLSDKNYSEMLNPFECANDIEEQENDGWRCSTTLPISANEAIYYARCKDQPWLANVNESRRNTMGHSYDFSLSKTQSALKIDSIVPNNQTIKVSTQAASVEVIVQTSGGYDGNAICSYNFGSGWIGLMETGGSRHRQVFQSFTPGAKALPIRCIDRVGNVAEATADFTIEQDMQMPSVTRVYGDGGSLVVITDENAECAYNKNMCAFEFNNGVVMDGNELRHGTSMTAGEIYYIKCRDSFGNIGSGCNIIVIAV